MAWEYDEWKQGWDFIDNSRRITKAMFMAVVIHCEKALYNMLYNAKEVAPKKEDLTIQNGMNQLEQMSWLYFGKKNVETISFKSMARMQEETRLIIENPVKSYVNGGTFFNPTTGAVCRAKWLEVNADKSLKVYSIHANTESGELKKIEEQLWNLAYQIHTIRGAGYEVSDAIIMYIDANYRKPKRGHDASKAFSQLNVTNIMNALCSGIPYEDTVLGEIYGNVTVDDVFKRINNVLELSSLSPEELAKAEPTNSMTKKCIDPFDCPLFGHCKKQVNAEDSIVWKINGLWKDKRFDYINMGYRNSEDLLLANDMGLLKLKPKQIRQLEYDSDSHKVEESKNSKIPYAGLPTHIEKQQLENWFEKTFPMEKEKLYFLDFETFQYAVPIWQNLAPYEKIPFQFSLHIYNRRTGKLEHFEFLAKKGKDPRKECARLLCEYIPMNEIVVAYNSGFEKSVCNALGNSFPEFKEHLSSIVENLVDLMVPFREHFYYKNAFDGKYSIKYVLPGIFPNDETLNYHNLEEIQNGLMAMEGYIKLQRAKGDESIVTRKNMLSYCALDTFAMVKIFWYIDTLILCSFDEKLTIKEMKKYDNYDKNGMHEKAEKRKKRTVA